MSVASFKREFHKHSFFITREMKRPSFQGIICDSRKSSVGKDLELCYLSYLKLHQLSVKRKLASAWQAFEGEGSESFFEKRSAPRTLSGS